MEFIPDTGREPGRDSDLCARLSREANGKSSRGIKIQPMIKAGSETGKRRHHGENARTRWQVDNLEIDGARNLLPCPEVGR